MTEIERGFGRRPAPDPRDGRYRMAALVDVPPTATYRYYQTAPVLDQGDSSSCVGHAWRQWLSSAPRMTKTGPDPYAIYREAQQLDEWPGAEPDYEGTSVRAGAKALQARGHVAEYRWASSADEVRDWLLSGKGSVVLGTTWYRSMMIPRTDSFVELSGPVIGGHAYLCTGYSERRGAFRCLNSWGRAYGRNGAFWIAGEDVGRLLADDGEACAAIEKRIR